MRMTCDGRIPRRSIFQHRPSAERNRTEVAATAMFQLQRSTGSDREKNGPHHRLPRLRAGENSPSETMTKRKLVLASVALAAAVTALVSAATMRVIRESSPIKEPTRKTDKEQPSVFVRTIPITPTPVPSPPVILKADDAVTKPKEPNVCERHGMRKVETHGGRSWRCR